MKDRTLDYLNQLKPFVTNLRNQGQQIYKNYRNEGMSNYPHMQDYQKTIAQLQAAKENEPNIINQYQQNKLKLEQAEAEKYKGLQGANEQLKAEQQSLQGQMPNKTQQQNLVPLSFAAQQMKNIKQQGGWGIPQKRNVQPTVNVRPPVVAPHPTNVQQRPQVSTSAQYPPGTVWAPTNWQQQAPWSFPWGSPVMGRPGEIVTYSGMAPSWYGR